MLAALHREGEVLTVVEGEQATAVRAKLAGAALAQFAPFLTSMPRLGGTRRPARPHQLADQGGGVSTELDSSPGRDRAGFHPPPYPYARLGAIRAKAAALPGGAVDLSVGSPCDPPGAAVMAALAAGDDGGATRGYPSSAGSPAVRQAAVDWMARRFGVNVDPALVALCIGTKEFVGWSSRIGCTCGIPRVTPSSTRSWPTRPMKWGPCWLV